MSTEVEFDAKFKQGSVEKVKRGIDEIENYAKTKFSAIQADFAAINDEITEYTSFSYLLKEQAHIAVNNLKGVAQESWRGFKKSTGNSLEKALIGTWDAFTDNLGELDNKKLDKAWSQFGDSFMESIHASQNDKGPEVFPGALSFRLAA